MRFRKYDVIHIDDNDMQGFVVLFDTYKEYTVATKFRGFYERVLIVTPDDLVSIGKVSDWTIDWRSKHQIYNLIDMIADKRVTLNPSSLVSYNNIVKGVNYYDHSNK